MPKHIRAVLVLGPLLLAACDASPTRERAERAEREPVLEFPEAGVDDPAAYEGYATRFFRDSRGNMFQIYLNGRDGRVVHVWADAANESAAFTVRDPEGRPAAVTWGGPGAGAESDGRERTMRHRLVADAEAVEVGWFLLGTMRQERDFQYAEWHRRPYGDPPFVLPELTGLIEALERLPVEERAVHLALLNAADAAELRSRLRPALALSEDGAGWTVAVAHTSLDGRSHLTLELRGDGGRTTASLEGDRVSVRALDGAPIGLEVTVRTDAGALTPLGRERLFNEEFEAYYAERARRADSLRAALGAEAAAADARLLAFRRLERQVLGLELLSSEQKLMASLPNYATYFGRDQMMSALMLGPISSVDLQELVIASVLRKVDARGHVSHEEALGGQAIREAAAEYAELVRAWEEAAGSEREAGEDRDAGGGQEREVGRERDTGTGRNTGAPEDEILARARAVLESLQAVRENYHMVDDDFQLLVLVDRYLSLEDVPAERKRRFLTVADGIAPTRLDALVRNLALVAELARPYAERPVAANLVGFYRRDDEGPLPGSWRDSRAGYGNGLYAMDVNAVWVPEALASLGRVAAAIESLGLSVPDAAVGVTAGAAGHAAAGAEGDESVLERYLDDPAALAAAVERWRGARRHFEVRLQPGEMRRRVEAALASLPPAEAAFWRPRLEETDAADRPLAFLALSLDEEGRPVPAPNTDPATALFLGDHTERLLAGEIEPGEALLLADPIVRSYPVGLFVDGLGPVIVNDAYASDRVRRRFREDPYHSPRVVWGREVNLILLGLARQIEAAHDASGRPRSERPEVVAYVESLRDLLERTEEAVEASGLAHNELWSYRIEDGELRPVRYGQSSDLQLWNVTDLAVAYLLDRLPPR